MGEIRCPNCRRTIPKDREKCGACGLEKPTLSRWTYLFVLLTGYITGGSALKKCEEYGLKKEEKKVKITMGIHYAPLVAGFLYAVVA